MSLVRISHMATSSCKGSWECLLAEWQHAMLKTRILLLRQKQRANIQQRARWLDGIIHSMDMSLSKLWERWWMTGKPGVPQFMGSESDITERLNNSNIRWQLAVWPWFPQFFQIILKTWEPLLKEACPHPSPWMELHRTEPVRCGRTVLPSSITHHTLLPLSS